MGPQTEETIRRQHKVFSSQFYLPSTPETLRTTRIAVTKRSSSVNQIEVHVCALLEVSNAGALAALLRKVYKLRKSSDCMRSLKQYPRL